MFDEEEDWNPIEETLQRYESIKNGGVSGFLDEEDFERVIEHYFHNSQDEQALTACEIAFNYHPSSTSILLLKAEILTQGQKYGQALRVLDELDSLEHHNLDAVLLKSDILTSQFKYEKAIDWLQQQVPFFPPKQQIEILLELADVYDESEDFNGVFETLKKVIDIDKRNEEALQKICFWAEFTGRLDESVQLHAQLTEDDPFNALAWFNLGAAYQGLKMYELCIDAYEYCVAIDEKFEFAYRNMADAFMRLKWFDDALYVLDRHIEIAKPEDVIFEAVAFCWEKKKEFGKARHYYRLASQLSPQDDTIFYKIGETYAREKQWEKAVKSFTVALHLDKENASYCLAIGNCLMEMNVKTEALVCYLNAVRLKPSIKSTWVALIRALCKLGYYDEVIGQIEDALQHCGEKGEFYYFRAAALLELGKTKEAVMHLEHALQLAPGKLKVFSELNAEYLLRANVAELISRYKKK
jgi:tetratricopeptide (TPR) repeat protein